MDGADGKAALCITTFVNATCVSERQVAIRPPCCPRRGEQACRDVSRGALAFEVPGIGELARDKRSGSDESAFGSRLGACLHARAAAGAAR